MLEKNKSPLLNFLYKIEQFPVLFFSLKWLFISLIVGILSGSASALFLVLLEFVTNWREANVWIIALLPVGGFLIGAMYHYWGKGVVKGNNLLLEEIHEPKNTIPLKMVPLVLLGTIATHFFGGSAGREGTAVQMGGAIADQFTKLFRLAHHDRKILIITGISAGFASIFGTPLAGTVFGLEVFIIGKLYYEAILPSLLAAIIADYTCQAWHVKHTHYAISFVPKLTPEYFLYAILAGICFGLVGMIFAQATHFWDEFFKKYIKYPPLRPFIGGIVVALAVWMVGTTKYIGLGVPVIVSSFHDPLPPYDFLVKIIFTSITLGSGFKGGEVTPLFYVGATLGNALAYLIPLPVALLAGMGFAGVFSGAANTPIACTLMGIELFGIDAGVFIGIACITGYMFSGHSGIYKSQVIGSPKHRHLDKHRGNNLANIKANKEKADK